MRATILLAMLFAAVVTTGCEFSVSTANISDVQLARSVDKDHSPVDTTSTFSTTDNILHCVATLSNAPEGTKVRAEWRIVDVPGNTAGDLIDAADFTAEGSSLIDFTFTPDISLPPGKYRVDLFVNPKDSTKNKPDRSVPFSVISTGPRIARVIINTNVDGAETMESIPSASPVVYSHVTMGEAPAGTLVTAVWIVEDTQGAVKGNSEIVRSDYTIEGEQNIITFSMTPNGQLPPGTYRVDLYVNKSASPIYRAPFTVR